MAHLGDGVSDGIIKCSLCYLTSMKMSNGYLVTDQPHSFISEELAKAIRDEVRPIASRLSKGLYRYAVLIDMLCQIIAYQDTEWSAEQLEYVRKFANARVAKSRGTIDLKTLLDDHWGKEYEHDNDEW